MKTHTPFKCLHGIMILSVFLFFVTFPGIKAQTAPGFNFQAVARDEAGNLLKNTNMAVTIGIRVGSGTGELVWEEIHEMTTNDFGLINLVVCGDPALKTGGYAETPADIFWSGAQHFIVLAINTGNREITLDPQPLRPVPYSLSLTGPSPTVPALSVQGNKPLPEGEALFQVKRFDGSVAFAVYEDMVRVYVDTLENKGVKGGFAVGGYRKDIKGEVPDYMRVTPDSIRFYIDQDPASGKGVKGGFAVGGYTQGKGVARDFLRLTPENYFIGDSAGANNTTGLYNVFLGYKTGAKNTEGYQNTFLGYEAGVNNTEGHYNAFIGTRAGANNLTGGNNVFLGHLAGNSNVDGAENIAIGTVAGAWFRSGAKNIVIGSGAGSGSVYEGQGDGSRNVIIGDEAGKYTRDGSNNVIIGAGAASEYIEGTGTGTSNVIIGAEAGFEAINASQNVFIGYRAGIKEKESNKLYIANNETVQPLIWGDFEMKWMVVNGNGQDNIIGQTFFVNGPAGGIEPWVNESDERLKKDIVPIDDALDKVKELEGIYFSWKDDESPDPARQMGFIAQQAENIIPEVISKSGEYYGMQYAPITALLVEAIKQQQALIDLKEAEIKSLQERIERLEKLVLRE